MSLFGDWGGDGRATAGFDERLPIPDVEFDKADKLRHEKEMLGLYVSDHPLFGVEAALRRKVEHSIVDARRARRRGDGPRRRRGHGADAEVHQARRPDGGVRARGPRGGDRGDAVPAHARRARPQARRRRDRRRQGPPRPARREPGQPDLPVDRGAVRAGVERRPAAAPADPVDVARRAEHPAPEARSCATTRATRSSRSTSARRCCACPTSSASTSTSSSASCAWPSATRPSSADARPRHARRPVECAFHTSRTGRGDMAVQVQTNDSAALTDADLDDLASMGGAFGIGELSKAKEDWVLVTDRPHRRQAARVHVLHARAHRRHAVRAARPDERQADVPP